MLISEERMSTRIPFSTESRGSCKPV